MSNALKMAEHGETLQPLLENLVAGKIINLGIAWQSGF